MVERNIVPDDVIFLKDSSDGGILVCYYSVQEKLAYKNQLAWSKFRISISIIKAAK